MLSPDIYGSIIERDVFVIRGKRLQFSLSVLATVMKFHLMFSCKVAHEACECWNLIWAFKTELNHTEWMLAFGAPAHAR